MNTNKKITVAVLFGGVSSEHDVSLMSAVSVLRAIPKEKYQIITIGITKAGKWLEYTGNIDDIQKKDWELDTSLKQMLLSPDRSHGGFLVLEESGYRLVKVDVCFPVLHGKNGEDGAMQGLFQVAGIPFVGCDMTSSADCMDKEITHTILEAKGIPMAKWCSIRAEEVAQKEQFDHFAKKAESRLGYPMFVKPASAGSSVGVSKAKNKEELLKACLTALEEDEKIIVEEYVDAKEVETAVLGNLSPKAAGVCGEIVPIQEFYTYDAKYIDGSTELFIPARIPEETSSRMRYMAETAFIALGCSGLSRIDFFVRNKDGQIVLNEVNTIPGFTSISMYPKLWEAAGLNYSELVDKLIQLGIERFRSKICAEAE